MYKLEKLMNNCGWTNIFSNDIMFTQFSFLADVFRNVGMKGKTIFFSKILHCMVIILFFIANGFLLPQQVVEKMGAKTGDKIGD